MDDLIEALTILRKYSNVKHPFQCEHDELYVHVKNIKEISKKDIEKLEKLGFSVEEDFENCFISHRFGSC